MKSCAVAGLFALTVFGIRLVLSSVGWYTALLRFTLFSLSNLKDFMETKTRPESMLPYSQNPGSLIFPREKSLLIGVFRISIQMEILILKCEHF